MRNLPKIVKVLGVVLLLLGGALAGAAYFGWQALLEHGSYPTRHGFRIDGKAFRALQAAQQARPGTHLVLRLTRAPVGPEYHVQTYLANTFNPAKFVTLETRGVVFEADRYLVQQYSVSQPVISHRGNNPTEGYTFAYWRERRLWEK